MSDKIIEGIVMLKKQKGSRKNETGSLQILGGHGKKKKCEGSSSTKAQSWQPSLLSVTTVLELVRRKSGS